MIDTSDGAPVPERTSLYACIHCGNKPTPPNFLLQYTDDFGEEYEVCQRCEDFEIEYYNADPDQKMLMANGGYGEWVERWNEAEKKAHDD